MHRFAGVLGLVGVWWLASFPGATAAAADTLAIGEQRSLPVAEGTRFSVGNPEVLQARATQAAGRGALLLLKAKSQGYSDVILLDPSGGERTLSFRVVSKRQAAMGRDGAALGPGVRLQPAGESWVAGGQVRSLQDWNRMRVMTEAAKGKVISLARLHPMERLRAQDQIQRTLAQAGLSHLSVVGVGNILLLQGDCASQEQKAFAEELAGQVFRGVRSHLRVPFEAGRQLRFRAKIMEVMKTGARAVGLQWSEGVPGVLQVAKALTKAQFSLEAGLKLLEKRGEARLLSEPVLALNEKGTAELRVGGEIPIPVKSRNSAQVLWKPYGLTLRLELPGVAGQGARTRILAEISSLDPGNGTDGVPGVRVSRLDTTVDLRLGRPVLLSGLTEKRQRRAEGLLPFLGDIPILGELFRSRDFQDQRSELMILLEAVEVSP